MSVRKNGIITAALTSLVGGMMLASMPVWAGWKLDNQQSSIHFASVKNDSVFEQHGFRNLSGSIEDSGKVSLSIDLNSVDTQIQIRDERMKKELFDTKSYPITQVSAAIDTAMLEKIAAGKTSTTTVEFELDLHGKKQPLKAEVQVTGLDNGGLLVTTVEPVVITADAFGLADGVNKLKDIAKLNSILMSVPVSANLVFVSE
ncbi:hypothetical protein ABT56_13000 [Photobacterium aquae]|uniref:Lipid/polyisoprenoid-binding YceI-like domain-containing protein n=1 Tax=Photobacterium aquae TaxID=1195763 RepID=A0A0J1H001_9GAMM|nr:YceI family protein [Photobacterium aquae]KLV05109.1 hypothetical protein ABT56_13000 [Photobacterium aquae]